MPDLRTLLRRRPLLALIILLVLLGVGYGVRALDSGDNGDGGNGSGSGRSSTPSATASLSARSGPGKSAAPQGAVALSSLPPQAADTVRLIQHGGPYPNRQDGVVFNNAERRLPIHPGGYYHEFTVATPGSADRGSRRIITGAGEEFYYTADHYDTFRAVNVDE